MDNKTRRKIGISVVVIAIAILVAFRIFELSRDQKDEALDIPDANTVTRVEFGHVDGGALHTVVKLNDSKLSSFIDDIKSKSSKTKSDSVSDVPVGVDYIRVNLYLSEGTDNTEFYMYEKSGKAYIEQPYIGIWEIPTDLFQSVNENKDEIVVEYED